MFLISRSESHFLCQWVQTHFSLSLPDSQAEVFYPFGIEFCVGWNCFHVSTDSHPVLPAPFVEDGASSISQLLFVCFGVFVKEPAPLVEDGLSSSIYIFDFFVKESGVCRCVELCLVLNWSMSVYMPVLFLLLYLCCTTCVGDDTFNSSFII